MVLATLASVLVSGVPGSQIATLADANKLASHLVELFNEDNAEGIRAMAIPDFFRLIPARQLPGLVHQVHSMGSLSAPVLTLDLGEQRHYKLTIKREGQPNRVIKIVLGAQSNSKYFSLGLGRYFAPKANGSVASDNPRKSRLDVAVNDAVNRFLGQYHPVGVSIGILSGTQRSFYNYGERNLGAAQLPTSKTVFEIGSITKTMTGRLIAQAVIDHKLDLGDDIRKYLPGTYPNLTYLGKPILLKHLVTHTSGLPANPPGIPDDGKADAYEHYSQDLLLKDLAAVKLSSLPGATFGYSNMGGGLCGIILERVYAMKYEDLLQRYILGPSKMADSGITLAPQMDQAYATPYGQTGEKTDRWIVNGIESAGAVRSTAEDMLSYAASNMNEKDPVVALSHQIQTAPGLAPVALFWLRANSRLGGHYVNHEGGTGGFTSHLLIFPERKLAIVILMNSGEQRASDLAYELALSMLKR